MRRRGNSAMMRARSAAVKPVQPSISARVRPQPMQRAEIGSIAQILLQGLSMVMDGGGKLRCKIRIAAGKAIAVIELSERLP